MAEDIRSTYRQPSFAGCEFDIVSTSDNFGIRASIHEYAQRDIPWVEEFGRRVRIFRMQGAIRGADHVAKSQELITKAECGGTQELVHPYYGVHQVKLLDLGVDNNWNEAGQTLLTFEFVEAGEYAFPTVSPAVGQSTANSTSGFVQSVYDTIDLSTTIDPILLAFIIRSSAELVRLFNQYIDWNEFTVINYDQITGLNGNPTLGTGNTYSNAVIPSIEALYLYAQSDQTSLDALLQLTTYGTSETGSAALYALTVRLTAIPYAVASAIRNGFTSPIDALQFMTCIVEQLEADRELIQDNCLDCLFDVINGLIRDVVEDLTTIAVGLPPIVRKKLCRSLPSLVAAYQIFGNVDSVEAFESINSRRSCLFMGDDVLYQAQ